MVLLVSYVSNVLGDYSYEVYMNLRYIVNLVFFVFYMSEVLGDFQNQKCMNSRYMSETVYYGILEEAKTVLNIMTTSVC